MSKMKILIFILGISTLMFSEDMITEGNYKEKFKEYNAYSDNYKAKLKDFVNAETGDLTFLNKYAINKTNIPLYAMGDFGWGQSSRDRFPLCKEIGLKTISVLNIGDEFDRDVIQAAENGIKCTVALGKRKQFTDYDINGFKEEITKIIKRVGVNGSIWKENPKIPYLPVSHFNIFFEPNIDVQNPPKGMSSDKVYYDFLKTAYETLKGIDPECYITAFQTSSGNVLDWQGPTYNASFEMDARLGNELKTKFKMYGWLRFIRNVNEMGGYKYYDAVGMDAYSQPWPPDHQGNIVKGLLLLRDELAKRGKENAGIWYTEIGYPMKYRKMEYEITESQQADWLLRLFGLAASHGVEHINAFHFEDFHEANDDPSNWRLFGFFTKKDGKVIMRQQATALKLMIELLPEPRLLKTISDGEKNYFAYIFKGAKDKKVVMLWLGEEKTFKEEKIRKFDSEANEEIKKIPIEGKRAVLIGINGNRKELKVINNEAEVTVKNHPAFIVID